MDPQQHQASAPDPESLRFRLDTLHKIIEGYRGLAYKLIIAHTGLAVALAYSAASSVPHSRVWIHQCLLRLLELLAFTCISMLFEWWLFALKETSEAHVKGSELLWKELGVPAVPHLDRKRFFGRMWYPILLLPVVTTLATCAWIILI